jgi:hypothetical protein
MRAICLLLFLGLPVLVSGQPTSNRFVPDENGNPPKLATVDFFSDGNLKYTDFSYRPTIKTVMLQVKGAEGSPPILDLMSKDQLHLQFDDLDPTQRQLYFSLEHCNADWKPSGVMRTMAIQGLQQDLLQDFKYSFNTRQQYLHYDLYFPNDNMKILLSGNYLLKVYEDGDPSNLVLTRRFMVFKNQVRLSSKVKRAGLSELRDTHQELDVFVDISTLQVPNGAAGVNLVIRQNGRWDNEKRLKPYGMNQNNISYDYDDGTNCFLGGNEFRWADIRSLRMQSDRVKSIIRDSAIVKVLLLNDPIRAFSEYQSLAEANGNYFIRNTEGSEPEVDADYAWVDFKLPFEAPLTNGNLFLLGAFSDWQFRDDFMLHYDFRSKAYTAHILLKQGIYNYSYVFLPTSSNKGDETYIEGSHFNTENDYTIYFYHRQYVNNFDELKGLLRVNSIRNQ